MSKLYNTKFKPTKAGIVQAAVDFVIKKIPRKKKVSPDVKSVKPTKDIKGSVERVKTDEFRKRYKAVDKAEDKMKTGKKMMREGQKERKKLIGTGRAVQFKHTKTVSAIKPGEKDRFKGLTTEEKPKKFKTGKQLEAKENKKMGFNEYKKSLREKKMGFNEYKKSLREKKMGGGMMGRRMGYSQGSNGKPISRSKNPGILAMSKTAKGRKVVKERFKFNPDRIVAKKGGKA